MQIGVHCQRGKVTWDECKVCRLNPLRPCHVTPDILQLMEKRPTTKRSYNYTPSRLTGCDRQYILMRDDEDYYEDVQSSWPLVRGTMIHAILENSGEVAGYERTLREVRLQTTIQVDNREETIEQGFNPTDTSWVPGQEVFTGQPDLLLLTGNRVKIIDYKTTEIEHTLLSAYRSHVMQINMYAWLVKRCLPAILGVESVTIDELEILYLSQKKTRRFTSVGALKDRGKLLDRKSHTHEMLTLETIPLLQDEVTEAWIVKRIRERKQAEHILPEILTGEKAKLCYGCPVKEKCYVLARVEHG